MHAYFRSGQCVGRGTATGHEASNSTACRAEPQSQVVAVHNRWRLVSKDRRPAAQATWPARGERSSDGNVSPIKVCRPSGCVACHHRGSGTTVAGARAAEDRDRIAFSRNRASHASCHRRGHPHALQFPGDHWHECREYARTSGSCAAACICVLVTAAERVQSKTAFGAGSCG